MAASQDLPDLRACRLLRRLPQPARDRALPRHVGPDHPFARARGGLSPRGDQGLREVRLELPRERLFGLAEQDESWQGVSTAREAEGLRQATSSRLLLTKLHPPQRREQTIERGNLRACRRGTLSRFVRCTSPRGR